MRVFLVGGMLFLAVSAAAGGDPPAGGGGPTAGDPIEGARIARRVGCDGCHGEGGIGKVFMEDAEQGRIVAPNLTQRRTLYSDAGLAALLHEGKTHDGHAPWGMPIQSFQYLSQREVRDIIAWLRALPAVEDPALPEGRWSDELRKRIEDGTHPWLADLKPTPGHVPPDAPPTEPLALGRHLALTTCSECHGWDLDGFGDPGAPPPLAIAKAYTDEQFARLMRTGEVLAGGTSASGLMTGVAKYRFNAMTDEEIQALKDYLDGR